MEFNFSIENDALIRNTIIPMEGDDSTFTLKKELIITKDVFVECCNRWMGEALAGGKNDTAAK